MKSSANNIFKICLLVLFVFPFVWMVSMSFQSLDEILTIPKTFIPENFNFSNYIKAWNSGPFPTYFKNSLITTFVTLALQLVIMIPAAFAFAKYEFWGKKIFFGMIMLSFMIPGQVTFIPVYLLLGKVGIIDTLLPQILPFVANAFGIFLIKQAFSQIPDEILEAARLDHTSEFSIMTKIMLPMIKPTLFTTVLFSFVSRWNDYFWPLVMTNQEGLRTLPVGIKMLKNAEGISQWNVIMAGNVILVVPIIIVYILCSKYILKSFGYAGIK